MRRSWGTPGDGIHWKATLSAMARGEDAIYVKHRLRRRPRVGRLDEYTPIIFLFSAHIRSGIFATIHDSNLTQRNMELQIDTHSLQASPPPDAVYSIFYSSSNTHVPLEHHLKRENLTSIAFLFTRESMGVRRYEAINLRPKKLQCRIAPEDDAELKRFSLAELGLAWAIKFANGVVIAVTCADWKPSQSLLRFAKQKSVKIVSFPLSALSPGSISRLRKLHFVSTALKKHPECERIVERFLN